MHDSSTDNPSEKSAETHTTRYQYLLKRCDLKRENQAKPIRIDSRIMNLGFLIRSQSLFYCAVPKVMTRILLQYITYLHIMRELIPAIQNPNNSSFSQMMAQVHWPSMAYLKENGLISKELQYAFEVNK